MERKSASIFSNCPFEEKSVNITKETQQFVDKKANPPKIMFADERTRGAINKATMPFWMSRPPFGIPRFKDITTLRRLGNTPQARMAKQTIIDEIVSIPWDIIPIEETDEVSPELQNKIDEVTNFLLNPNTNNESFEFIMRQMLEDNLDMDSGVWIKEFDQNQRMVELRAYDGATFLKNPNQFGKYDTRADIIPFGTIIVDSTTQQLLNQNLPINSQTATNAALTYSGQPGISMAAAREEAAYFQYPYSTGYSYTSGVRPIAFGRKELVWFEKNPQTNQIYGKSPIETIQEVLQTLKYSIEYNLDYFEDNNVPKGFINMTGADEEELSAFRDRWNQLQLKTNAEGLVKKNFHRVPMSNADNADFVRVQFSAQELQLIESQTWFSKLVWANFGVTPSELGFTEDSNLATEVNQGRVFKRKAILPLLRMIEYYINNEIISEWDFNEEIKFEFNTFDVEDEKSKWELYKLQKDGGFKTANEIRRLEGLEELDELDEQNMIQTIDNEDSDKLNPKESNPKTAKENAEKKASQTDMAMILREIRTLLNREARKILRELNRNKSGRLAQIKDFNAVLTFVKNAFNIDNLKSTVNKVSTVLFNRGMNEVETLVENKDLAVNTISSSPEKISFLSNMAFDNFKDMAQDTKDKLIQQLKIGISNNEGIGTLSQRVQNVVKVSKSRAEAISRTESNRIENQGALHAAQQVQRDGVNIKKYLLWTDDSRTCELTKALHRKYGNEEKAIPIEQNFKLEFGGKSYNQSAPPFHINERDQLITFIIGE